MSKKEKLIISFCLCFLIAIALGASYAYFSAGTISSESIHMAPFGF